MIQPIRGLRFKRNTDPIAGRIAYRGAGAFRATADSSPGHSFGGRLQEKPLKASYISPFALTFATAIFADCVTEIWGTDELGIFGSFHLHATDIAAVFAILMIVTGRYRSGKINVLRIAMVSLCGVAAFSLARG